MCDVREYSLFDIYGGIMCVYAFMLTKEIRCVPLPIITQKNPIKAKIKTPKINSLWVVKLDQKLTDGRDFQINWMNYRFSKNLCISVPVCVCF